MLEKFTETLKQIEIVTKLSMVFTESISATLYLIGITKKKKTAEKELADPDLQGQILFGNFDYMRAELEVVHSGEQFWVNSFDNSKIDCMILPG
mmetsp:Transcript_14184/g.24110  ORF Transcript_14184/g.24110 Transcript_14184/m.24110 type:complete len:94 (-) Transcript_14184:374-655(-)